MEWARLPFTLPLYLAAALAFAYTLYALRNRPSPIALPFAAVMLSIIIWCAAYALELGSSSFSFQLFWMRIGYLGKLCLPVAFLWFAYQFSNSKQNKLKPFLPFIFLEALLSTILVWTSGAQGLFFESIEQVFVDPLYLLNISHGPVFWLQIGFLYLLLATGSYILFKDFWNLTPAYRNRFLMIILCVGLPVIANIITIFRLSPMPQLDLTAYTFLVVELIILWGIIHFHFLEIMTFAQQTIVENTNDAVLVVDVMDKIIYSNPAACSLLGLSKAAIIGKPIIEVWPLWSELMSSAPGPEISAKPPDVILQREIQQSKDAVQQWYRLTISNLNDQGRLRLGKLVVWNDITPTKQTDDIYQFGQKRLSQLVDNSPNPIFSIDWQGIIKSWNPACETTFKYGKEVIGQKYTILLLAQDTTILDDKLAQVFCHGESIDQVDIEFVCKDGSTLHMVSRLYPLLNQSGEIDTCVIANTDITERKHAQEKLSRQLDELRMLHSVALACVEATNEDALIERVTAIIGETFFPDNFGILLFDETTNLIHRHPSYRERVENLPYDTMELGNGITSRTIQTGQSILVPDTGLEPTYFEVDRMTRSELCVPLKTGERVIGVINTESSQLNAFTDSDERLLTILAGHMASTIERLRASTAEQHRAQELLAITRISQEINSLLDLQQVLNSIVRYAAEISNSSASGLFLYQPDGRPSMVATYGVSEEFIKLIHTQGLNEEGSAVGRAIRLRQPYQIPDIAKEPSYSMRHAADLENIQAILALPMFRGEDVIGGIVIWNRQPHSFSHEEERFLQALANQSVNAVENARLFEAEREQRKLAEVMREAGSRLSSLLDFNELLDNLLEQLERLVPYDGANVMLVEGSFIHIARIRGYEQFDPSFVQNVRSLTLEIGTTANLRKMLETKKPLIVSDTSQDPDWIEIGPEYPIHSWAGAPIFIQNRVAAIFSLDKADPGFYQPDHARRLEIYAGQVGLALQNSQLFMVTQQQAEQMAELAVLGGELNRPLTVDEVVRGIGQGAMSLGKASRGAVYLREAEDTASCAWRQGLSVDYVRRVTEQVREVPGNQLFRSIEPVLIPDTEKLPADSLLRKLAGQEQFRAVGLWPLVYEGKVVAAVGIYYDSPHSWDDPQKEILLAFTRQSAIAVQNTRLFSETQRRAVQQEALNKIIAEAVKAPELSYLVETVLDLTLEAFGSDIGGLWLSGFSALRGLPPSLGATETKTARNHGSTFHNTLVVEDWQHTDHKTNPWKEIMEASHIRASLSVPVVSGGKRIGGLAIAANTPRLWQPDEITLAEAIGQQVGSAAERLDLLKQTQEQARLVQMIIDTVPEGVLLLDIHYRVILANPAARKYLSTLLGKIDFDQPLSRLADQPIARLLEATAERGWHELQTSGESNQIYELAAQPLEVAAEISGWVLVLRDVTEERANLARVQMQERLATVGQLAAGIAHDFNNIMAAVVVYTDLLAIDPDLQPDNRQHVKIIQQQIQRASSLIRQILDFSRQSIMEPSPIDLLPFIKELDRLLGRILPENILLRLSYAPGAYMIRADPTSLQQVFMNLALNARDAMSSGGILQFALTRLTIAENERPPLPELPAGNWIRLSISDNGIGIPENALQHIFDPFFTTKPAGRGTGLGLAQVYGIIKQHGGSIDVKSTLGEGTTFRLYFPELSSPQDVSVSSSPVSIPRGEGEQVLLVEDDFATREALQYLLENQNYKVYTAQDGIEALRMYDQPGLHIDLVVSDIVMPGMGGLMLYSALRERESGIRMLFITGHPMELENQALLEESRLKWLQKPFSMEEFISAIRLALISIA